VQDALREGRTGGLRALSGGERTVTDETPRPPEADWETPDPPAVEAAKPPDVPSSASLVPPETLETPGLIDFVPAPSSRYPEKPSSPSEPRTAEVWRSRPDPPPPPPPLAKRLAWLIPVGVALAAGVAFVAILTIVAGRGSNPDLVGKACFIVTLAALIIVLLVGPSARWATSPYSRFFTRGYGSSPMAAVCIVAFAAAPTLTWIMLAMR